MIEQDDLQKLWQNDGAEREDSIMWRQLLQEKRSGWDELVRTEDQTWYLIALCFIPLTAWAAWKAKYPWVHVGYGVMATTFVLATVGTWIAGREQSQQNESNLREHLEALLESYDRRSKLIRRGGQWVMVGLTVGLAAVFLGIPGSISNPRSWIITILSVVGANAAMWLSGRQSAAKIFLKRDEAARLLKSLLAGGQVSR